MDLTKDDQVDIELGQSSVSSSSSAPQSAPSSSSSFGKHPTARRRSGTPPSPSSIDDSDVAIHTLSSTSNNSRKGAMSGSKSISSWSMHQSGKFGEQLSESDASFIDSFAGSSFPSFTTLIVRRVHVRDTLRGSSSFVAQGLSSFGLALGVLPSVKDGESGAHTQARKYALSTANKALNPSDKWISICWLSEKMLCGAFNTMPPNATPTGFGIGSSGSRSAGGGGGMLVSRWSNFKHGSIKLINADTLEITPFYDEEVATETAGPAVRGMAASPDGRYIASYWSKHRKCITLWDLGESSSNSSSGSNSNVHKRSGKHARNSNNTDNNSDGGEAQPGNSKANSATMRTHAKQCFLYGHRDGLEIRGIAWSPQQHKGASAQGHSSGAGGNRVSVNVVGKRGTVAGSSHERASVLPPNTNSANTNSSPGHHKHQHQHKHQHSLHIRPLLASVASSGDTLQLSTNTNTNASSRGDQAFATHTHGGGGSGKLAALTLTAARAWAYMQQLTLGQLTRSLFPMFHSDTPDQIVGEVVLWDVELHQPKRVLSVTLKHELVEGLSPAALQDESLCSICFSPCGEALACGGINTVFLIDANTGKELCKPVEMRWEDGARAKCIAWTAQADRPSSRASNNANTGSNTAVNAKTSVPFAANANNSGNSDANTHSNMHSHSRSHSASEYIAHGVSGQVSGPNLLIWRVESAHRRKRVYPQTLITPKFSSNRGDSESDRLADDNRPSTSNNDFNEVTAVAWGLTRGELVLISTGDDHIIKVWMLDSASGGGSGGSSYGVGVGARSSLLGERVSDSFRDSGASQNSSASTNAESDVWTCRKVFGPCDAAPCLAFRPAHFGNTYSNTNTKDNALRASIGTSDGDDGDGPTTQFMLAAESYIARMSPC